LGGLCTDKATVSVELPKPGILKEKAIEAGEKPPFVELTGAHLAMPSSCNA
jgi:pyruvate/2-oxoglutarate dehydrogenase complex dihydrolipoamide acyltransferase (E2) component